MLQWGQLKSHARMLLNYHTTMIGPDKKHMTNYQCVSTYSKFLIGQLYSINPIVKSYIDKNARASKKHCWFEH